MTIDSQPLLDYVRLRREASARRAAGGPPPWSDDPIIASRHFCCVVRDDDRTSREARAIIQGPPPEVAWSAALTFRLYNRPETLTALLTAGVLVGEPSSHVEEVLRSLPVVFNTVAYRVTLKGGLWNLPTLSQTIYRGGRLSRQGWRPRERAEIAVQQIQGELGIGPFLAYQVMQDLRWLRGSFADEDEWCLLGGGAVQGMSLLTGSYVPRTRDKKQRQENASGKECLSFWNGHKTKFKDLLPSLKDLEPRANMFELEHNLCEYRKWEEIRLGTTVGRSWRPRD